ncbi:hypothetical protein VB716_03840 [Synechococcus sp. CCY9201]|uniref:hypothetical protein n=1 Tax=Synechococcus sp. CCY9201 TaxID=174697 RepID=UPI002B219A5A|nr:hypothetical protein [Synechococcus sp. CCY9201]MEA5473347.1 hypothetical protein [Synechococcus sp. CCY9201]
MAWDPEALTQHCQEITSQSCDRDPRVFAWGLFAWGDAPPAIGGGVGAFQWFNSLEDVLEFVTDLSPAGYMTFEEEDWLQLRDTLRKIAKEFQSSPRQSITDFNSQLKSLLQIDWIGSFEELLSGDEDFARKVRVSFREDWIDQPSPTGSSRGIDSSETNEFIEFLDQYGI